jgi:hypothetical protein
MEDVRCKMHDGGKKCENKIEDAGGKRMEIRYWG